jgi:SAM-dependent methyltransferase
VTSGFARRVASDLAKSAAMAIGPTRRRYLEARRRKGYNPEVDRPEYARSVFERHRDAILRHRAALGDVLEVGPGSNVAVAALFLREGAPRAASIDIERFLQDNETLYKTLGVDSLAAQVEYLAPAPIESVPFSDASFDVILSHACFEHFADPALAIREIARLLRPGGVTTHQIDLRDHADFSNPLMFLRYPDWLWALVMSPRLSPTNRWRASDFVAEFERAGLAVHELHITDRIEVTSEQRRRFSRRFQRSDLADLGVLGVFLVATKPDLR